MQVKGFHRGEGSKYFVHSCSLDVYYFMFTFFKKREPHVQVSFHTNIREKYFCIKNEAHFGGLNNLFFFFILMCQVFGGKCAKLCQLLHNFFIKKHLPHDAST